MYQALKVGKIEEDIALERYFKPVMEPIKQMVENNAMMETAEPSLVSINVKLSQTMSGTKVHSERNLTNKTKGKRSHISSNKSFVVSTPMPSKRKWLHSMRNESSSMDPTTQLLAIDNDAVFETIDESLLTSVRHQLQTADRPEKFRNYFSPLG